MGDLINKHHEIWPWPFVAIPCPQKTLFTLFFLPYLGKIKYIRIHKSDLSGNLEWVWIPQVVGMKESLHRRNLEMCKLGQSPNSTKNVCSRVNRDRCAGQIWRRTFGKKLPSCKYLEQYRSTSVELKTGNHHSEIMLQSLINGLKCIKTGEGGERERETKEHLKPITQWMGVYL